MYQFVRSVPATCLLGLSLCWLLMDCRSGCAQVGGGNINGGFGGGLNGIGGGANGLGGGGSGVSGGGGSGGSGGGGRSGGGASGGAVRPDRMLFFPTQIASTGYIGGAVGGGLGGMGGLGGKNNIRSGRT